MDMDMDIVQRVEFYIAVHRLQPVLSAIITTYFQSRTEPLFQPLAVIIGDYGNPTRRIGQSMANVMILPCV